MESLHKQLKNLGDAFIDKVEINKSDAYDKSYKFLVDAFEMQDDVNDKDYGSMIQMVFAKFFEQGFYNGIKFIMDPDNENYDVLKKLYMDKINENSSN